MIARWGRKKSGGSEAWTRDLIRLIEQGRPLPERCRFLFFDDRHFVFVDQKSFEKHAPRTFADLVGSFVEYQ